MVWKAATGRRLLDAASIPGTTLDFSPDGTVLATVGSRYPSGVHLYRLPEGQVIKRFQDQPSFADVVRFDPSGRRLAYCAADPKFTLVVLSLETGERQASFPHPNRLDACAWGGDGRWLAVACRDRRVYVYDMDKRRRQAVLEGHEDRVVDLAFSPGGDLLASTSRDNTTRLWDPVSGRQWVRVAGGGYPGLRFGPDGRRLAFVAGLQPGVWEVADGSACRRLYCDPVDKRSDEFPDVVSWEVDFSGDGRLLALARGDGVRVWDAATGRAAAHLDIGPTGSVRVHPRDGGLVTYGLVGLFRWPLRPDPTRKNVWRVGPPRRLDVGNRDFPRACWDGTGALLAVTDHVQNRAVVLRPDAPARKVVLPDCPRISSVALSPDGRWAAATAGGSANVKVWETATGTAAASLPAGRPHDAPLAVAFTPDGRWLVVGSEHNYGWWRAGSWERGLQLARNTLAGGHAPLAFRRDGRLLAVARTPQAVQLVDPDSGEELATLTAPDRHLITGLCFSPDGRRLAAATEDHVVQLWDLEKLRERLAAAGLEDPPPAPPAPAADAAPPIRVEVDLGDVPFSQMLQTHRRHAVALPLAPARKP